MKILGMLMLPLWINSVAVLAQTPAPERVRPGSSKAAVSPDPNTVRPIAPYDTVFIDEMTWLEVRDALRAGKTTAILAAGGIEQSGPYLAVGKHQYILRATTEAIARKLGNALVAPIVPFVPEGQIAPPTSLMRQPGTIGVTKDTFERLLTDITGSLRTNGFQHICFLADHAGDRTIMQMVAKKLNGQWGGRPTVNYIVSYYNMLGMTAWLEARGIHEEDQGLHDDYGISALMMVTDPMSVRMPQRLAAGNFSINGVSLAPAAKTIAIGRRLVEWRADAAVNEIRQLIGSH